MPRGRGGFGRGFGQGWFGRGFGNPYPFCRRFPWLPRWWWAYPGFRFPYYGNPWSLQYIGYGSYPFMSYPYPIYASY